MNLSKIALMLLAGIALLMATACSGTMRGAGDDIEEAGDKIQEATR